MKYELMNYEKWAEDDWRGVDFGDARLNSRAISIAADFMRNPFFSPPKIFRSHDKLKAFYRFVNSDKVTHRVIISKHTANTKTKMLNNNIVLAVQDSTTITLKRNYEIEGLYDVGNIPGVVVQNTIAVTPSETYGSIEGLLQQTILRRKPKYQRTSDDSEITLWTESIKAQGEPPIGTTIVDVMDRGADALEVMHCSLDNKHEFLIRARSNRYVNEKGYRYLFEFGRALPTVEYTALEIKGNEVRKKRTAKLRIAFSSLHIDTPKNKPRLLPLHCNLIHALEVNPPQGEEPLEWFLLTSLDVKNCSDALEKIKWYSYRWIIEEYHKCLKTGFRLEKTQLQTLKAIESLLGLISVAAVKLLQLRDIVRVDPEGNALEYVDKEDIQIAKAYYHVVDENITIDRFLRLIAKMGGFLNRKGDGNPGWQSLWEGWKFFMGLKEGVKLQREGGICG